MISLKPRFAAGRKLSAALVAALSLLAGGCSREEAKVNAAAPNSVPSRPGQVVLPAGSPKLAHIKVAPVQMIDVPMDIVEAPGNIEVNPNRVSHIVSPVPGRVVDVYVGIGDSVQEGQAVVKIESPDADAAISAYLQADSAVGQMKANALKAQADLDRSRDLLDHQAVAKKDVLNAENVLVQATALVEQARASRTQALRRLEILGLKPGEFGQRITIHSPVSGKVLEMNVVQGEYRNDTNAALMTIADLNTVWVASDVPETQIRQIQVGEPLELQLAAYPGEIFKTRVMRISDTVDPTTRTIKVRAELDNRSGRLRPQMFGRIRHSESIRRLPAVPASAVLQAQNRAYVYCETAPGVFEETTVVPGNSVGDQLSILRGLSDSSRVVVEGPMLLRNN
ncbi:MAG: efflux RND transporter periplasmic adaptor subunit [Bryobacterales bacterium]|nr:efflux RND transporter periplasmic adaptor subunit [Bryobacterales bacterium]